LLVVVLDGQLHCSWTNKDHIGLTEKTRPGDAALSLEAMGVAVLSDSPSPCREPTF
jgi:hypothetical protein